MYGMKMKKLFQPLLTILEGSGKHSFREAGNTSLSGKRATLYRGAVGGGRRKRLAFYSMCSILKSMTYTTKITHWSAKFTKLFSDVPFKRVH